MGKNSNISNKDTLEKKKKELMSLINTNILTVSNKHFTKAITKGY